MFVLVPPLFFFFCLLSSSDRPAASMYVSLGVRRRTLGGQGHPAETKGHRGRAGPAPHNDPQKALQPVINMLHKLLAAIDSSVRSVRSSDTMWVTAGRKWVRVTLLLSAVRPDSYLGLLSRVRDTASTLATFSLIPATFAASYQKNSWK